MDANCAEIEMGKEQKWVSICWNGVGNGNVESELYVGEEPLE